MNAIIFLLALLLAQAGARDGSGAATLVEARFEPAGAFTVDLHADLDALLLGMPASTAAATRLSAMEALRAGGRAGEAAALDRLGQLFRRRVRVRFDGTASDLVVEFPERRATATGELVTLGSRARLRGSAPAGARTVTVFASRSFRGIDLRVEVAGKTTRQVLEPGEESSPIDLP
jgi:hypothetical protein